MLGVLLAVGLLPLLAMGTAAFVGNREELETRARGVLEAMVKNRRVTIELFLEEKLRTLELLSGTIPAERLSDQVFLEELLSRLRREHGGIIDLGVIGENGRHVVYVGPYNLQDRDYSGQPWFDQVMVSGRYESDVFLGFRRFPHMVMAVRFRDGGRQLILRATLDTELLSELVREGGFESGAEVFILNRAGEYQTESDDHALMEEADIGAVPRHSGVRVDTLRLGARRVWVATTWLRGDSWVLVARQQVPGYLTLLWAHPVVLWVFLAGLVVVPVISVLVARVRLRQIREIESHRASLFESVAQSQKMAAVGRLAAGVAHEINNPLAIIDAQVGVLTDILDDEPEDVRGEDFRQRLGKIEAQVARARKVTHRLLGFSRRVGPDREPVDVTAALEETVGFVEREAEAQKVHIERVYEPDVPIVRSSVSQLQQVFLNLINNALDAVGRGGTITLAVRRRDAGVAVVIADDGPGIPARDLERIFEPFYSTKGEDGSHSGLGLAICREILTNLGGTIAVDSRPAQGTRFTIVLLPDPEP